MDRKLSIGILVDGDSIPSWAYTMLERIQSSSYAQLALVIRNGTPPDPPRSLVHKAARSFSHIGYIAFQRIEPILQQLPFDPFTPKNIADLRTAAEFVTVEPIRTRFSDRFPDDATAMIREKHIDVLVRLGFRILRGDILTAARYGVWSYHHGDSRINRGVPAGFWETMEGWPTTGSVLQILTEDLDGGQVLYRSHSPTDPVFVHRNKANYYWKSLSFLPRMLEELHRDGEEAFFRNVRTKNEHPQFYDRRLYSVPSNLTLTRLLVAHYASYIGKRLRALVSFEQWILLYSFRERGIESSFWRFRKLIPPKDRFWADPFVVFRNGRHHLFVEEFPYSADKGHIAHMTLGSDGTLSAPSRVLERSYHLSYPFIFEYEGEMYMIPETSANRTVELYRATEFPLGWEFVRNLMEDVAVVDATLLEHGGRWWMFANSREHDGASRLDELFLFYADSPLATSWLSHPMNPVVSDVRSARPAGKIFSHHGNLYRPSQNSEIRYGHGMKINQIVTLTDEVYEERCVQDIKPLWDNALLATHTLNSEAGLTVIDASLRRRKIL